MPGRIYIIGAGASRNETKKLDPPLPLATEFFKSKYLNKYWPDGDIKFKPFKDSSLLKVLEHYFNFSYSPKNGRVYKGSKINIEEVYSFLENSRNLYRSQFDLPELFDEARRELLGYIFDLIRYVPWHIEHLPLYSSILKNLNKEDSIITFNWDLLFEKLISSSEDHKYLLENQEKLINPYGEIAKGLTNYWNLAYEKLHSGYLLKLHGSINMAHCINDKCIHNHVPYRFSTDEEMIERWSCQACGSPLDLMVVPPYIHKTYTTNRFLRLQSVLAAKKIAIAEEIIIIGYSIPFYDFDASVMLRIARNEHWLANEGGSQAFLNKVIVVNPEIKNKQYVQRVRELLGLNAAPKKYGKKVSLELYDSIEKYMNKYHKTL